MRHLSQRASTDGPGDGAAVEDFEARWRERFRRFAEEHDDEAGIAGWSASGLETRFRLFRHLWRPVPPGGTWVDAGCGAGTYARFLAANDQHVVGADYSLPTLRKAQLRPGAVAGWCVADVRALPVRSGAVDGVLCFGVTQALSDPERAVSELLRVVRTGGWVWIDALNRHCLVHAVAGLGRRLTRRPSRLHYESPFALRRRLHAMGVTDLELHWLPMLPRRLGALQPLFESATLRALFRRLPVLGALLCHSFILVGRRGGAPSEHGSAEQGGRAAADRERRA